MSRINVISGDFLAGDAEFQLGLFTLRSVLKPYLKLTIPISNIKELEAATEEVVKKQASIIRWSLARVLLLGPVGLVAGWLLRDKEREITFFAMFKDGRYLLAITDIDTYSKISQSPQVTRNHFPPSKADAMAAGHRVPPVLAHHDCPRRPERIA
jgi:hypothetical protein